MQLTQRVSYVLTYEVGITDTYNSWALVWIMFALFFEITKEK